MAEPHLTVPTPPASPGGTPPGTPKGTPKGTPTRRSPPGDPLADRFQTVWRLKAAHRAVARESAALESCARASAGVLEALGELERAGQRVVAGMKGGAGYEYPERQEIREAVVEQTRRKLARAVAAWTVPSYRELRDAEERLLGSYQDLMIQWAQLEPRDRDRIGGVGVGELE